MIKTYEKACLLSLYHSPYLLWLEPLRPPLRYANSFHALAPSHVLCPLSGNYSPLFAWLTLTHPSGTSLMSPLLRSLPRPLVLVFLHLYLAVWCLLPCFLLSFFSILQLYMSASISPIDSEFPEGISCSPKFDTGYLDDADTSTAQRSVFCQRKE